MSRRAVPKRSSKRIFTGPIESMNKNLWLVPNAGTWESYHNDREVVNPALFAHWTQVVGETASLLGHRAEAESYARTAGKSATPCNKSSTTPPRPPTATVRRQHRSFHWL